MDLYSQEDQLEILIINPMFGCCNKNEASLSYVKFLTELFDKARIRMRTEYLLTLPSKVLDYNIVFSKLVFRENKRRKTTQVTTS